MLVFIKPKKHVQILIVADPLWGPGGRGMTRHGRPKGHSSVEKVGTLPVRHHQNRGFPLPPHLAAAPGPGSQISYCKGCH